MNISKFTKAARKALPLGYCGAVIVAAGTASRMGGIDKIMAQLGGEPLIRRTVRNFQNCDAIREIVVVTRPDLVLKMTDLCHGFDKVRAVVQGGDTRQASVSRGLSALSEQVQLVAVHDGARPFAGEQLIDRVVRAAHSYGAAIPGVPVKDTVKAVQGGLVLATPDRNTLRAVQTPQAFDLELLKAAFVKVQQEGLAVTDESSAVEMLGMSVKVVEGSENNIKITTPLDLKIAEMLLEEAL